MTFSVLLSVYVKESVSNFNEAFSSIWDQQTLKPTQIVLVKDGVLSPGLDNTIASWKLKLGDTLTVVSLPENVGLAEALNEGLKHCEYDLVARMDTDDIALSYRFDAQIKFMKKNPDVVASSGFIQEFDDLGRVLDLRKLPLDHKDIVMFAKRRSPLSHPAVIFRRDAILAVGGYPLFRNAQDYALWSVLIVKGYKLANLAEVLVKMRTGSDMYNRRGYHYLKKEVELLKFQYKVGLLSGFDLLFNTVFRTALRLSPDFVKRLLYRIAR